MKTDALQRSSTKEIVVANTLVGGMERHHETHISDLDNRLVPSKGLCCHVPNPHTDCGADATKLLLLSNGQSSPMNISVKMH